MNLFKFVALFLTLVLLQGTVLCAEDHGDIPVNKILLLDDFDSASELNLLGGKTQGDEEFPGGCIPSFVSDPSITFGRNGQSLKLDYDVLDPNSFSYYWSKTGSGGAQAGSSTHLDLTPYRYLSFWIKSSEVAPRFQVEFHQDKDNDKFFVQGKDVVGKIPVTRFLTDKTVENWRKIVIPFTSFKQIEDWSKILEIVFVFENKNQSKKGTLYVDDILFGSVDTQNPNLLEPIEKKDVFGYFEVNGTNSEGDTFPLKPRNDLELVLKVTPKHLERVHFDISMDGGKTWKTLKNFYNHVQGEGYRFQWMLQPGETAGEVLLRACVSNFTGQTTVVAGPLKGKV